MATDTEIFNWFKELGMKVELIRSSDLYFHFTVAPPSGMMPISIIRPRPDSTYYIVAVSIELEQEKLKNRPDIISEIKRELFKMNVEFFFTPDDQNPKAIQISRIIFAEGLTKNEVLNNVTLVKNSALLLLEIVRNKLLYDK
ncbi:DUF2299 family protein [Sulfolobus tengchongensis]|uniref:DUF2299 family protein n=1 Tax=Sulfolobus tengchongensis TaxID=207809 RepID=A0AAX4KWF1_9CREN